MTTTVERGGHYRDNLAPSRQLLLQSECNYRHIAGIYTSCPICVQTRHRATQIEKKMDSGTIFFSICVGKTYAYM